MKVGMDELRERFGEVEATQEAVQEAAGEAAEGAAEPDLTQKFTLEDFIDFKRKEDEIKGIIQEENKPTFTESVKEAIADPEIREMLKVAWRGTENNTNGEQPTQTVNPELESKHQKRQNPDKQVNTDMIPDMENDGQEQDIDYKPEADEMANLLEHMVTYYADTRPNATAMEMYVDISFIFQMAQTAAGQEPDRTAQGMKTLLDNHPGMFEEQLGQEIEAAFE